MPIPLSSQSFYKEKEITTKELLAYKQTQGHIHFCSDCKKRGKKTLIGKSIDICGPCLEISKYGKPIRSHKGKGWVVDKPTR